MDPLKEELQQISTWCTQEGLDSGSPKEAQLCFLWRAHQHIRSRLSAAMRELDVQHAQHLAEMAEVCKSLEQIRNFTEQKNLLTLEIQDENDQLKDQLQRFISLQDAQLSEVAKMLYQQGLTELVHCSPSEQVAYLLVERDSLLETEENQDAGSPPTVVEHIQVTSQPSGLEKQCSRLERDLEEGSRRLAMAHNEIRRLTDEVESAHLTQRTYEPELQNAQQEVEQLRQEVGNLKKYEIVELRKAKELNDRLESEVRALRNRVHALHSEDDSTEESNEVKRLESSLNQQEKKLQHLHMEAKGARELAKSQAAELMQSNKLCRNLEIQLNEETRKLLEKESEIQNLKQNLVQNSAEEISLNPQTTSYDQQVKKDADSRDYENCSATRGKAQQDATKQHEECPNCQDSATALLAAHAECETLKREICHTLKSLDKERSKYHEKTEKHKVKLSRLMQKLEEDTRWRDEKIEHLEREKSLCSHSFVKENELVRSITAENEKLLDERRSLLQQLNEEQHNSNDGLLTAALSKRRVEFLELENKNLGNKILHMSDQLSALERRLQSVRSQKLIEDLKKTPPDCLTTLHKLSPSVKLPELSKILASSATNRRSLESASVFGDQAALARSAEAGYLNLTSALSPSDETLRIDEDLNRELETC